jgi:hypothetical protein
LSNNEKDNNIILWWRGEFSETNDKGSASPGGAI